MFVGTRKFLVNEALDNIELEIEKLTNSKKEELAAKKSEIESALDKIYKPDEQLKLKNLLEKAVAKVV